MKQENSRQLYWVLATVILAQLLTILPWPRILVGAMPQWALIVTLFWVIALPQGCGVGFAFFVGLLTDCITGSVLGQHACVFVLLSYFALKVRMPLRYLPLWQQMLLIGGAALTGLLVQRGVVGLTSQALPMGNSWLSVVMSAFFWPIMIIFFHRFQSQRGII